MISFGNKETRMDFLNRKEYEWTVTVQEIPKPTVTAQITPHNANSDRNNHFVYICVKEKKNE